MPQPPVVEGLPNPLIELYRRAWERVVLEQDRIIADPLRFRRRARLTEIRQAIERELDLLELPTRRWLQMQFPRAYAMGVANGIAATGGAITGWTSIHREAVQEMANGLFDDLLGATQHVRDDTKRLIRDVIRNEALQSAIAGDTAQSAGRIARDLIERNGITSVVYRNGARHGLADYSEMAMRSTTAIAYNRGTLNADPEIGWFEIFDGHDCGLTFHDDPTLANGMVVDRATAEAYPIAHPRCQRSLGPRPDITSAAEAKTAAPSTTPDQRADQAAAERARREGFERRAAVRRQRLARRGASRPSRRAATTGPGGKRGNFQKKKAAHAAKVTPPAPAAAPQPTAPPSPGPAPTTVSDAVRLPRLTSRNRDSYVDIQRGIAAIDATHRDGPLPQIPLRAKRLPGGTIGRYSRTLGTSGDTVVPDDINVSAISQGGVNPGMTAAHEIGHFIDNVGFGTVDGGLGYASELAPSFTADNLLLRVRDRVRVSPLKPRFDTHDLGDELVSLIDDWAQAVLRSDAYATLGTQVGKGNYLSYLRSGRELWARSYSQFIVKRNVDVVMKAGLKGKAFRAMQWADDDFGEIEAAIEAILRHLGWMDGA